MLGSLIEKEHTTPEYYPLSLNALVNACNQKSNREPVMSYDEDTVISAVDRLMDRKLVFESMAGGRVPKYMQNLTGTLNLIKEETAVLCVLFLRGAQTIGEIRGRTERIHKFEDLDQAGRTIKEMMDAGFVKRLARQPGRKEPRYAQLLCRSEQETQDEPEPIKESAPDELVQILEDDLRTLRQEFDQLKQEFMDFKKQFE